MSLKYINRLIPRLISEILEQYPSCKERELNSVDLNVGFVTMPCYSADNVWYYESEDAIEEEQEEDDHYDDEDEFDQEDPGYH